MKALVCTTPHQFDYSVAPMPVTGEGETLLKIDRFNFTKKEPDEEINININLIKLINYIFRSNQNPKTFNDAIDYYQKKLYHLIEQQGVLITERKYSSIYQKKIFNHSINYEKLNIELKNITIK